MRKYDLIGTPPLGNDKDALRLSSAGIHASIFAAAG
jgi:hypothetical protein